MTDVIGIDPGTERSGWVLVKDSKPVRWGWDSNNTVTKLIEDLNSGVFVAVEYMRPRGLPTSQDEMDTMFQLGRMTATVSDRMLSKVSRHSVKMHLLGQARGNDSNIRQALIDLFGGDRFAIGNVKCKTCKGKGWNGVGRPKCNDCHHVYESGADQQIVCPIGCGFEVHPGVLAGISGHVWSALAVAMTFIALEESEVAM